MSNYFLTSWLLDIVCGLVFGAGGCLLSWWIGFRQSKIAQRMQANLLHLAAREHGHTALYERADRHHQLVLRRMERRVRRCQDDHRVA